MEQPLQILLITPDTFSQGLIEHAVGEALGIAVDKRTSFATGDPFDSPGGVKPSLVIADATGEELGGPALLREIKRSRRHVKIPIIVFAPKGGNRVARECLQLGANAMLECPISTDELIGTIWWLLRADLFKHLVDEDIISPISDTGGAAAAAGARPASSAPGAVPAEKKAEEPPPPSSPVTGASELDLALKKNPLQEAKADSAAPNLHSLPTQFDESAVGLAANAPLAADKQEAGSAKPASLVVPSTPPSPSAEELAEKLAPAPPPGANTAPATPISALEAAPPSEASQEVIPPPSRPISTPAARRTPAPKASGAESEGASAGGFRLRLYGYEIESVVGSGGMATVYRAKQISLDRPVAVKVIARDLAQSLEFSTRFVREAKVQASLVHPHVAQVFDLGTSGPLLYIVMEYIEGDSLRDWIEDGRLSPLHWAYVAHVFGEVLSYLHSRHVIHRDIKPANLLIGGTGLLKLSDFGIAYRPEGVEAARLTAGRRGLGTPFFMPPEQRENPVDADHRADIFALAVTLHTMIVGGITRHPLPALRLYRRDIPPEVDAALRPALEADPFRRPSDVREITEPFIESLCAWHNMTTGEKVLRTDFYRKNPFTP